MNTTVSLSPAQTCVVEATATTSGGSPSLRALLNPRSIAILGASDNPVKPGGRPIDYLKRQGFQGPIYPVNPQRAQVQGLPCYASLADVPTVPDCVVISLATDQVLPAVQECVAAGVQAAIIYSAGFSETGPHGDAKQQAILEHARAGGMRLLGPNTQGAANYAIGAALNFSSIVGEFPGQDGPIAIVSQSGAGAAILYGALRSRHLGVRYMVSTGNEADITTAEAVQVVAQDEHIGVIVLYMESIRDPGLLAQAARTARMRNVPIIAVKAGRTASGQATASSHTGALAAQDNLVDALLRQHGIIRADDFDDLIDLCQVFVRGHRTTGFGVASISNSGAACVLAADAADIYSMTLVQPNESDTASLRAMLPAFVTARNPVDLSTALFTQDGLFEQILALFGRMPGVDMMQIGMPVGAAGHDFVTFARQAAAAVETYGKPIVVSVTQPWVGAIFEEAGLPVYRSERAAMRALSTLARYCDAVSKQHGTDVPLPASTRASTTPARMLNEAHSLRHLAQAVLPVVAHRLCRDATAVAQAFAELGPVVVAKGVSQRIAHKSEAGLVKLNLGSPAAAQAAYEYLYTTLQGLGESDPEVLIARQHKGDFELVLGAHRDPVFGPVVMIGQGGVLVEAIADIQFLVAPFSQAQARETIGRLRIAPAFAAVRGMPAVDVDRLAAMMVRLGHAMADPCSELASVDANPVIVARGETGPVIVDALVEYAEVN